MLTYCNYFKIYTCYHFIYAVCLKTNTMSHVNSTGGNLGKVGEGEGRSVLPPTQSPSDRLSAAPRPPSVLASWAAGRAFCHL